jgi:hypothetical protein
VGGWGEVQLGSLGTAATNGLLCQPRKIVMMEKLVEWLARETEILGENLPQRRCPDANPGRRGGKRAFNRLTYGTAIIPILTTNNYKAIPNLHSL